MHPNYYTYTPAFPYTSSNAEKVALFVVSRGLHMVQICSQSYLNEAASCSLTVTQGMSSNKQDPVQM